MAENNTRYLESPFKMSIYDSYKSYTTNEQIILGKISSGYLKKGMDMGISCLNKTVKCKSIKYFHQFHHHGAPELEIAKHGDFVVINAGITPLLIK
jgi:translation elongation factor EF-1alpha